ncbi:hypothetical protein GF357_00250 [Candidatus Dojkabacteria bacterium]|nr:hypothetical protein [Candidatus Dojkabacteria bacterium]
MTKTKAVLRRLKSKAQKKQKNKSARLSIPMVMLITSTTIFCVTQLAINISLNPRGAKLESLNREKTMLIEENRQLQEEIAKAKSLAIVTELAEKKLELSGNSDVKLIHISDPSIVAEAQD